MTAQKKPVVDTRLPALRRFATAITILNLLGQTVLGFEPGWIHLVAAITTSYSLEALLEFIDARLAGRPYAWSGGGVQKFVDFFLPSHITALAVAGPPAPGPRNDTRPTGSPTTSMRLVTPSVVPRG